MTGETPGAPDRSAPVDELPPRPRPAAPPAGPPAPPRRSPLQILVIVLLVLIPTGYAAVAAVQSREGDGDRHSAAAHHGLLHQAPSHLQRSIYRVELPYDVSGVGSFEANSWHASSLYVRFTTTDGGLDTFLAQLGTGRSALRAGRVTVGADQAAVVGWRFAPGHRWAGLTVASPPTRLTHRVTVDLDSPHRPVVYVVSTTVFH